jgi:undecaprenyl diphosphate synthase
MERVRDTVTFCLRHGVEYLTLYAFSTENWTRPTEEVDFLMNLFEEALKNEVEQLASQNVRVRFIGLKNNLPLSLQQLMEESETQTQGNSALVLNLAINYGGRAEIVAAAKAIACAAGRGEFEADKLDEASFGEYLFTAGQPDPDLLIRTSGELRLSNFMLYQTSYAEWVISPLMWPDFSRGEYEKTLLEYQSRNRRYGDVGK